MNTISAEKAISDLAHGHYAFIDVRSPNEFKEGHIPGFVNQPILNDSERHQVGLTYKNEGQQKAIEEGLRLVLPQKSERVAGWLHTSRAKSAVVTCWRGGLRSKYAAEWMNENGVNAFRVEGGYKNLRHALLQSLENPPPFTVVTGLTGTGKTKLIQEAPCEKVDLEMLACHRGSSFGHDLFLSQPTQATFENSLGLSLRRKRAVLIEDESRMIGQICVPVKVKEKIVSSPVIILESPIHSRVELIFDGYVRDPLMRGKPKEEIRDHMIRQLSAIKRYLGGALHSEIEKMLKCAFEHRSTTLENHADWIRCLLLRHYDPRYQHAFERLSRPVIFQGEFEGCLEFLSFQLEKYQWMSSAKFDHQPEMVRSE
jgi:tRNA 2-selenouridine synthase